jgi:hypothetical protein
MKIPNTTGKADAVGSPSGIRPAGGAGQPSGPRQVSSPTDRVQLSSLAQMAAAYGDSPAHLAKLSSLSATVSSGGYHVDAGVLSNSIIEASLTLSGGNYI